MDERQKLQSDLKRYRTIRDLISDERVVAAIEELIRETKKRLSQIEASSPKGSMAEIRPGHTESPLNIGSDAHRVGVAAQSRRSSSI